MKSVQEIPHSNSSNTRMEKTTKYETLIAESEVTSWTKILAVASIWQPFTAVRLPFQSDANFSLTVNFLASN